MACATPAILELSRCFTAAVGHPRGGWRGSCSRIRLQRRSIIGTQESELVATGARCRARRRKPVCVVANSAPPQESLYDDDDDDVLINPVERASGDANEAVEYDWEQEWYPMYLASEVPKAAPLGVKVFDKPLVLFFDGKGELNCVEDRCPHRLAKLSEGQVIDGKLECLYHGWQFDGSGQCTKIPQLVPGAKIPKRACAKPYAVKISQDVVWVWLGDKASIADGEAEAENSSVKATATKRKEVPWFEHYAKPGFQHVSTIHELPYDYSILLENLMDPAHIPISHDKTDPSAIRENAQALVFELTERTSRGFAGRFREHSSESFDFSMRFEAPCTLTNTVRRTRADGSSSVMSAVFLCRPTGQGTSMVIARFGSMAFPRALRLIPPWLTHKTGCTVFEQDMGFLASQNETLLREGRPTGELYLNIKSSDAWVMEFRRWCDAAGHGLPYYFGHSSVRKPRNEALLDAAPAGAVAAVAAHSYPARGSFGAVFAKDPTNRYFRHVVHCTSCLRALQGFRRWHKIALAVSAVAAGVAITLSSAAWRASFVALALAACAAAFACSQAIAVMTQNFIRPHRQ